MSDAVRRTAVVLKGTPTNTRGRERRVMYCPRNERVTMVTRPDAARDILRDDVDLDAYASILAPDNIQIFRASPAFFRDRPPSGATPPRAGTRQETWPPSRGTVIATRLIHVIPSGLSIVSEEH